MKDYLFNMAIEKERKFLLEKLPENFDKMDVFVDQEIEQGYLMFDDNKQLRVRIVFDRWINTAFLTYKTIIDDVSRNEYEYYIPMEDAYKLLESTDIKVKKRRRWVEVNGHEIVIDLYPDGLLIAEIEYITNDLDNLPGWLGEDVTNNKEYSNLEIAKKNQKSGLL
jgi:CYTH domain-containing protein